MNKKQFLSVTNNSWFIGIGITVIGGIILYFILGENSPISNVISPQGSIITQGQSGGTNTVTNVTYSSTTQRHLDQETIDYLKSNLPQNKMVNIQVMTISGSTEGEILALEIQQYLLANGYVKTAGFIGSFVSNAPAGIHVDYNGLTYQVLVGNP